MTKLMTNNQGLNFAKLGRDKGVTAAAFEEACGNGKVNDFLAGLMPQKRLALHGEVLLPERVEPFDPHEFFKTRKGLYVWNGFRDNILPAAKPVEHVPERKAALFELEKAANDAEIRAELPEGHVFENASEFCAHLASLIEAQPNGEDGDLLNNGYATIRYVRGVNGVLFAAGVGWGVSRREWGVRAVPLDDDRWLAGLPRALQQLLTLDPQHFSPVNLRPLDPLALCQRGPRVFLFL